MPNRGVEPVASRSASRTRDWSAPAANPYNSGLRRNSAPARNSRKHFIMAIPFRLGTFSAADCARFGGFIVDERALAFNALDRFLLREQLDFHCDGTTFSQAGLPMVHWHEKY